jgi:hypothetical protein
LLTLMLPNSSRQLPLNLRFLRYRESFAVPAGSRVAAKPA